MNSSCVPKKARPQNPEATASFLSRHSFWHTREIFRLGIQQTITEEDIYECLPAHGSHKLTAVFSRLWDEEKKAKQPDMTRVLWRIYAKKFFFIGIFFNLMDTICKVAQPQFLGILVLYFAPGNTDYTIKDAFESAVGIVVCTFVMVLCYHGYVLYALQMGMRIRQACSSMIYNKALRLSKSVVVDGLNGQVINLMSTDVSRFDMSISMLHDVWKGPLELLIMAYFIFREIGVYGLVGIAFLLCFLPIQTWMGHLTIVFRERIVKRTDRRVKIMNEIIQAIQVIKMYTWEQPFAKIVDKIRMKELNAVRGIAYIKATLFSFKILSRVALFISLLSYIYSGNNLAASKVFIVSSYFNFLYISVLRFWPLSLQTTAEASVSIRRVQEFLMMPENKKDFVVSRVKMFDAADPSQPNIGELEAMLASDRQLYGEIKDTGKLRRILNESAVEKGIHFRKATGSWLREESGSTVGIKKVDLDIVVGRLCAVVGVVGSGKSTLFEVILGELELDSGVVKVDGTVSYASQEPWLFEGTIEQNILFVEPYEEERYKEVIKVCALERDFDLLPYGDQTIVGERGSSLSGGQRARVNLARAIYRKADIYLLDDPLSAVDAHVGKHIFQRCVRDFLKDKVCVLATHQLQYLKDVEHLVLMQAGEIVAQGAFRALKKSKKHSLLLHGVDEEQQKSKEEAPEEVARAVKVQPKDLQKTNKETQSIGSVGLRLYKAYFSTVKSPIFVLLMIILFIITQVATSCLDIFISKWVTWEDVARAERIVILASENYTIWLNSTVDLNSTVAPLPELIAFEESVLNVRWEYVHVYSISMLIVLVMVLVRSFGFFKMCLRASRNMHDHLFRGITRGWMSFFNTNPSGRILNRFSKDIDNIDTTLPVALNDAVLFLLEMIAIIVLVSLSNYWLLLPTLVMSGLFYGLRYVYVSTARPIKRIESLSRSPIFNHANATLQGMSTIRVNKAQSAMAFEFDAHLDHSSSANYIFLSTTRAFALWLELLCVCYMAAVVCSFLLVGGSNVGGQIGLAITQIFNLIGIIQWGMRQTAELENQMTSVERVDEYANIDPEPPTESEPKYRPAKNWPVVGDIRFSTLSMRYTKNSDCVLRQLSFDIKHREKIGIVGRTGAGKSSIIQALFRLAHNEGSIIIDGLDTANLGLHDLRSKISIIPQEPILFSGNMRSNLDPFEEKSDADIWDALAQVELKKVVAEMPNGLNSRMSEGGTNFSMGQRQLVCLARAILRNNKILILDEATANIDPETDRLIQDSIRDKFRDCTVLTIAHRLHTIMDSDRVLVVDAGRAVEFDHPFKLLSTPEGFLSQLVEQTGEETAKVLKTMAENHFKSSNPTSE